jgi:hypothetical protein
VILIASIWLAVAVACGDDAATGPVAITVGPEGGTLSFADGRVTLLFPPGAVDQEVPVTVSAAGDAPPSSRLVPGTVFEFGPAGIPCRQVSAKTSSSYPEPSLLHGSR